jgi:hypothetical protein
MGARYLGLLSALSLAVDLPVATFFSAGESPALPRDFRKLWHFPRRSHMRV